MVTPIFFYTKFKIKIINTEQFYIDLKKFPVSHLKRNNY